MVYKHSNYDALKCCLDGQPIQFLEHSSIPFEISVDIVVAVVFGQVHEHTCGTAALSGTAEAAVTDAPARRAKPLLEEENNVM